MKKVCHIIVAAGSGSRYGAALPKQFCLLEGRMVVSHAIERLRSTGAELLLVLSADRIDWWHERCRADGIVSPPVTAGGATRWESVANALRAVVPDTDIIGVHDGARPLVSPEVTLRLVEAVARGADGAVPVVPVTDSIRQLTTEGSEALDRGLLRAVHTPQVFDARKLRQAYALPYRPTFTDDASVMEAAGFTNLALVDDSTANIKITRQGDIELAAHHLLQGF